MKNENNSFTNEHSEILLVGAFYQKPSEYINYGQYIRKKYDFSDEATKFFYTIFEQIYKTLSEEIDEVKVNTFVTQNDETQKKYKRLGGFKTIENWMTLADENDIQKYFDTVKKYALIREYNDSVKMERLLNHKKFSEWNAGDVYRIVRAKVDRIKTKISANKESVVFRSSESLLS